MFEDIRISYGLTRNQVAVATGRSINYLLKAEQCTFPSPPVALLAFYTNPQPPEGVRLLTPWEAFDRQTLCDAYFDSQRRKRQQWLDTWLPVPSSTNWVPLRHKWLMLKKDVATGVGGGGYRDVAGAVGLFHSSTGVYTYPTGYQLSSGLCIPASVVYRNEKEPRSQSSAIRSAMGDLVEFVESGRFLASNFSAEDAQQIELGVMRIAKEEGWTPLAELHSHQQQAS